MRSLVSYGFLAPPALFITLSLVGAVTALVWWRIGIAIVLVSTLCLYVAATPAFSSYLAYQLETEIPENVDFSDAGAIVVLGRMCGAVVAGIRIGLDRHRLKGLS
jgi:hypothetical protein